MTDTPHSTGKWWLRSAFIPALACVVIAFLLFRSTEANAWQNLLVFCSVPLVLWLLLAQTERLTILLFALIPLSIPFHTTGGAVLGFPSEALLLLIAAYLFLASAVRPFLPGNIFRHPVVVLILAEVIWMLICGLLCDDPVVSLKRVFMRALFVQVFLLYPIHLFLKKGVHYYVPFLFYGVGLIWPVIHSYQFHMEFYFAQSAAYKMCMPFFVDHTIYGACIAFVLPMLLIVTFSKETLRMRGALHFIIVLLTVLLIAAEILSFSRAAWVSLIAAGFFALLLLLRVKLRGVIALLAIAGIVTAVYSDRIYQSISENDAISNKGGIGAHLLSATNVQSDASNTERINRWICAWKMALDKPITGHGPGMYQFVYGKYQERVHMTRISTFSGNRGHAHSEYFTPLSETGFPGGILFLVIVITVIGYGMKVIYSETDRRFKLLLYGAVLGLITFYVHGVFNAFLDADKMAALVFVSIAIIVSASLRQTTDPGPEPGADVRM